MEKSANVVLYITIPANTNTNQAKNCEMVIIVRGHNSQGGDQKPVKSELTHLFNT